MKRSELRRKTPLEQKTPLRRVALGVSPASSSARHREQAVKPVRASRSGIPAKVRKALALRSGGWCEIAQPGCTGQAAEFAHRKKVGAGGRKGVAKLAHDVLSNALHACWNCHHRVCHAKPKEAYTAGWMVEEWQDPVSTPVLYRGRWRWLLDDGQVVAVDPASEEVA
jgi:5-methylcytosine-specific restriction enzyme A